MTTELDQSPMHDRSPMMDLLQSSTVAGPDDAERLLPGLDEAIATAAASAQPPSGRHRRFAWGLGAVAAAAVVAFVLLPHGPPPAQPLERDLVQSGSGRDIVLLEGVNLRVEGSGSVGGGPLKRLQAAEAWNNSLLLPRLDRRDRRLHDSAAGPNDCSAATSSTAGT